MSVPKLYGIFVSELGVDNILTARELTHLSEKWPDGIKKKETLIVHCGFMRPQLGQMPKVQTSLAGKVLYTAAVKWALPNHFRSSAEPVYFLELDERTIPCYLALNEWGYEIDESVEISGDDSPDAGSGRCATIAEAATKVLKEVNNTPLSKYEIFNRIDENYYYEFNTPKPVHVLDVTLNRETIDTHYSRASKNPRFGKTHDGKYFLLTDGPLEPKGWIRSLKNDQPSLYRSIREYGVGDDLSYIAVRENLPESTCCALDVYRYKKLLPTINEWDPCQLVRILPSRVLRSDIKAIDLPVRPFNVLSQEGVTKIHELADYTLVKLQGLPNMGRKSIGDLCDALKNQTAVLTNVTTETANATPTAIVDSPPLSEIESLSDADAVSQVPLIQHVERTLESLNEIDRQIIGARLGIDGKIQTLQEIADQIELTRERVRQRQSKQLKRIVDRESWDDLIGIRIGQLLLDRNEPLILELLDVEDAWFAGFAGDYVFLSGVIQAFSENEIRVIDIDGRRVVSRITRQDWESVVKKLRIALRQKASEKQWKRSEIDQYLETCLSEFDELLLFEDETEDGILVAYGKSAESAIAAVLAQAESPLHFSEIAKRAGDILGSSVDERTTHNALGREGVWLYDRGTYGLIRHCPISETKRQSICRLVEHMLYEGPINRQWHSSEIIDRLMERFPGAPQDLDPYVLRMCIEKSKKIVFLKRMVWARADSGMTVGDRIDTTDSFIQILEQAGEPLTGAELKRRLSEIRGVSENMQIHGNDRLITVAPNVWGLSDWY
jgi:hypothetical protein